MSLRIAKNLELPNEAVTQTFAILAKRGVGKTYTASVMVEEMLKNELPVVVIDPIGVWWGLRSSADGKKAGLPIIVAGGEHADVPIEDTSGEILANLVVDQRVSVVIDLSLFRKGQQIRFMQDFAETLYHRNRQALHVVVDEADAFAPQKPQKGAERLLGAMEDLVRRGRARGIGLTLITQRPAVLNKNVLTQIEVLVTLRLISPQDRAAIKAWVEVHGDPGQSEELMHSLPSLPIGTAWFWSPGWLDLFQRVEIRKRETLDSSSTPKVGQQAAAGKMAEVNIDALREKLAATIEKVQSEDPKILQRRIRELESSRPEPEVRVVEKQVEVIPDHILVCIDMIKNDIEALNGHLKMLVDYIGDKPIVDLPIEDIRPQAKNRPIPALGHTPPGFIREDPPAEVKITGGAQRMLDVLGSRYPMTFTKSQLAALSKMSPRSGTFSTYMSLLKSNGLIELYGDQIKLTDQGRAYVGDVSTVPQTSDAVIEMWRGNLTGGARRMFDALVKYYPEALSKNQLGGLTGMSQGSGTFSTYLSMLKRNGLIEVNKDRIKANRALFVMEAKV